MKDTLKVSIKTKANMGIIKNHLTIKMRMDFHITNPYAFFNQFPPYFFFSLTYSF